MKTIVIASVLMIGSVAAAHAADIVQPVVYQPPVVTQPEAFSWEGIYFGALAGYDWSSTDTEVDYVDLDDGLDLDGFAAGLFAGYNFQTRSNLVFGIEAEVDYNWADDEQSGTAVGAAPFYYDNKLEMGWGGSVRGRIGYAWDRTLLYGTAGWELQNIELKSSGSAGVSYKESDLLNGWSAGVGVDYAFTKGLFGRLEYRYADFPASKDIFDLGDGTKLDLTQNRVTVGLGYRF